MGMDLDTTATAEQLHARIRELEAILAERGDRARKLTVETKEGLWDHLERELKSPVPIEVKQHLLHLWVCGLLENVDVHAHVFFEPPAPRTRMTEAEIARIDEVSKILMNFVCHNQKPFSKRLQTFIATGGHDFRATTVAIDIVRRVLERETR